MVALDVILVAGGLGLVAAMVALDVILVAGGLGLVAAMVALDVILVAGGLGLVAAMVALDVIVVAGGLGLVAAMVALDVIVRVFDRRFEAFANSSLAAVLRVLGSILRIRCLCVHVRHLDSQQAP
jgi:hypothetical protein